MKPLLLLLLLAFGWFPILNAQPKRVIAQTGYAYNNGAFHLTDSVHLAYSGGRHSDFDYNTLGYLYDFGTNQGTAPDFVHMEVTPNNYDSIMLPHVFYNSAVRYFFDTTAHTDSLDARQTITYNTDNTIDTITNWPAYTSGCCHYTWLQKVSYNAGRLISVRQKLHDGTQWIADTISRVVTYNSSGNIALDSIQGSGNYYTYNAAGKWLTKATLWRKKPGYPYYQTSLFVNTYYTTGQLWTATSYYSKGPGLPLKVYTKDSLTYRPGTLGYTGHYQFVFDTNGNATLASTELAVHFNARQQKDSIQFFVNTNTLSSTCTLHYDADGYPTAKTFYYPSGQISGELRWSYEPYTPTGIPTPAGTHSASGITLSPNPTHGTLTLHYAAALPKSPLSIRITDMTGRVVYAETLIPDGTASLIQLSDTILPGCYSITVAGDGNDMLYNGTILKQ